MTATPQTIELLAPARDLATAMAAIEHGADAVYMGATRFGARQSAGNSVDDIRRAVEYAHQYGAKVYATVNTIVYDDELDDVRRLIGELYHAGVDALIVQDMGILRMDIPPIQLHASTQCDIRTADKAKFLEKAGFSQLVLARELTVDEIRTIRAAVDVPLEYFVHGALCVSYSGRCYASCALTGRSANRGECAQICRLPYDLSDERGVVERGKHLLSLKDNNQSDRLEELLDAGVTSLKIEGRLKDVAYVKNVTAYYSERLNDICRCNPQRYCRQSSGRCSYTFEPDPAKSFNRGFTHYFSAGRTPEGELAAPLTPKSIGERVGTVATCKGRTVAIRSDKSFANGDGFIYFDAQELKGFRANRVDGNRIETLNKLAIASGTSLYRNYDKAFADALQHDSSERRIDVNITLTATVGGVRIDMEDGRGGVSILQETPLEPSKADQSERQRSVFAKLGGTPYRLAQFDNTTTAGIFLPASLLNQMRRRAVEAFERQRRITYPYDYRRREDRTAAFPSTCLTYADNVSNRLSRAFYRDHGVTSIEPAMETSTPQKGAVVMTTRYCIRRQLGACLKTPGRNRLGQHLTLTSGNIRLAVEFDCRRCEMILRTIKP
ncbi:MAG: U32 family peptidase [Bacteroidales bacterium]|nr:U32 family peptidase [Bacteroidales bacterium]